MTCIPVNDSSLATSEELIFLLIVFVFENVAKKIHRSVDGLLAYSMRVDV